MAKPEVQPKTDFWLLVMVLYDPSFTLIARKTQNIESWSLRALRKSFNPNSFHFTDEKLQAHTREQKKVHGRIWT